MLTVDTLSDYLRRAIAEAQLGGDSRRLKELQTAAGVVMAAAHDAGDRAAAHQLQGIAAEAANRREEIVGEE